MRAYCHTIRHLYSQRKSHILVQSFLESLTIHKQHVLAISAKYEKCDMTFKPKADARKQNVVSLVFAIFEVDFE